jgi:CheY-like chemotaxis protein
LAITKKLIDAMGGSIRVTSAPGEGTTFSVFLPMDVRPHAARSSFDTLRGIKVMSIDDNQTNRRIVEHYLSAEGIRFNSAASAAEGLKEIEAASRAGEPFDMILLDYQMPGTDGMGFLRALRTNPTVALTGCIVLSSLGDRIEEAKALDVAAWLTKPIRKAQLLSTLMQTLERHPREDEKAIHRARGDRYARSRLLLVEDNPVNQLVASRMLKSFGIEVQIAGDGEQALELMRDQTFDLVLMDCQMPVMDGYVTTERVRASEHQYAKKRLPIVAITANALFGDRERCMAAGMDDYLSKPITREALTELLSKWLLPDQDAQSANERFG